MRIGGRGQNIKIELRMVTGEELRIVTVEVRKVPGWRIVPGAFPSHGAAG